MNILEKLSSQTPPNQTFENLSEWIEYTSKFSKNGDPLESAIMCGFHADRLGFAFASGYLSATQYMFKTSFTSMCATENIKGAPPNSIQTRLISKNGKFYLNGSKSFVTLGSKSQKLAVLCKDDQNRTKVVLIPSEKAQFYETERKIQFIPEISHSAVKFDNIEVNREWILEGDGFNQYIKPFRTLEDIFVFGAFLGYLYRVSRRSNWNNNVSEKLMVHIFTLYHLGFSEKSSPYTHIVFEGFRNDVMLLVHEFERLEWFSKEERQRFDRDKPIMFVAQQVRIQRSKKAWNTVNNSKRESKI